MSEQVARRGRGRPKGSKNKNRIISGATVEDYCKLHNHNPTEFLIRVGKGEEVNGIKWCPADQMRANAKLHDSIHNARGIGKESTGDGHLDGQFEIVFEESTGNFQLPGTTDAESGASIMREKPLQRLSDS